MTPQPQKVKGELDWSEPDPHVDEDVLVQYISGPLTFDNLQPLLVSNMYAVQSAYDRRATRDNFSQLLIHTMNFNNCMARVAMMHEAKTAAQLGQMTDSWVKQQEDIFRTRAEGVRREIISTLELLRECRDPGEPVS